MTERVSIEEMQVYDWREAWKYASPASNPITREVVKDITIDDVAEVLAASAGANDERPWLAVFRLKDGRHLFLSAWCDYTGWDCQAGGSAEWTNTIEELRACISEEDRKRLWPEPSP
jgi:hypothetical protein